MKSSPIGVYPPKPLMILDGEELVAVIFERYNSKRNAIVSEVTITTQSLLKQVIEEAIKRKDVVILRDAENHNVAYEQYGRDKYEFPHYRTKEQNKVEIEKFPWEK